MEITENEKEILAGMARYLKEQNRLYTEHYRLAEQFLFLSLPILVELRAKAELLLGYVKALKRQTRLVTVYHAYTAGKRCGRAFDPCDTGFLAFLCSVFSAPDAEMLEERLWAYYREIACRITHPDLLDELTDLYRDMQSRSGELALEVFEAGYIAGLKQRETDHPELPADSTRFERP